MARNSISEDHFYGGASGASSRRGSTREGEPLYPSSSPEDADSEDHEEDDVEYDAVFQGDDDPTLGPNVVAKLATLKPPPKDVYSQSRLPKSILKKGCITAAPGADASSTAGGPGQANRGASNSNNKNGLNASSLLSTASVHPMANDLGPNSLPPAASHRANLVTRSPVPNHQQQQQHIQQFQKAHDAHPSLQVPETSPAGAFHHHLFSPFGHHPSDSTHPLENHAWNAPWSSSASHQDHGAAIPANFHVGEVSPPGDRGGEPPLGDVQEKVISPLARPNLRPQGMGDPYANPTDGGDQQMNSGRQDNEHQLVMMMIDPKSYLNARAMNQIQGNGASYMQPPPPIGTIMGSDGQSSVYDASANTLGARIGMDQNKAAAAAAAAAATARRIGFLSTVEIIPAHRKSEYNRRSDKNATFKVLTPDMKGEIRDELNAYKMREMAVHVESMGNTAFH
ncbi:hypothetical protein DFQ27_007709 [Actinomortierella ambigua]|uniref:Uncharacterized protein n=1 Tax=Actinomortierella ambigua TaxID=1343610 RepID=A0A9P6PUV8_9FUNG|nr:hypothetical protein DFQ27_007709 [Actinomortierella ambigua]